MKIKVNGIEYTVEIIVNKEEVEVIINEGLENEFGFTIGSRDYANLNNEIIDYIEQYGSDY